MKQFSMFKLFISVLMCASLVAVADDGNKPKDMGKFKELKEAIATKKRQDANAARRARLTAPVPQNDEDVVDTIHTATDQLTANTKLIDQTKHGITKINDNHGNASVDLAQLKKKQAEIVKAKQATKGLQGSVAGITDEQLKTAEARVTRLTKIVAEMKIISKGKGDAYKEKVAELADAELVVKGIKTYKKALSESYVTLEKTRFEAEGVIHRREIAEESK